MESGVTVLSPVLSPLRCGARIAEKYRQPFQCGSRGSEWRDGRPVCGVHARSRILTWFDTGKLCSAAPRRATCEATTRTGSRCGKPAILVTRQGHHYRCTWHTHL